MKNMILCCLAAMTLQGAYAQKLPNKQEGSLKAPTNVKIDGKVGEWGDFKAYNSATGLYYTLANDGQNLYLILKAANPIAIEKLFGGGISLYLNNPNNVAKDARAAITYLAVNKTSRMAIAELKKDTIANDLKKINNAIASSLKTIIVKNLDDVKGDSIPVYNDYGIMAASHLVNTKTYTCEISVPLKNIKSFINSQSVINYTLQANAQSLNNMKVVMNGKEIENAAMDKRLVEIMNKLQQSEDGASLRETMNDTNVSGEYMLVK